MGFALCYSPCVACGKLMTYNPVLVPSIRVNAQRHPDPNGSREPLCRACVDAMNTMREAAGLALVVPHPDAYEACDETELEY